MSRRAQQRQGGGQIGYLLNSFPVLSETFIRNEVDAVAAAGVPLAIVRLEPPRKVSSRQRPVDGDPVTLDVPRGAASLPAHLVAHLALVSRRPTAYASTLRRALWPYLARWRRDRSATNARQLRKRWRRLLAAAWIARASRLHGIVHLHAHYVKEPLEVAELVRRLTGLPYSLAAHAKDLYTVPEDRLTRRLRRARFAVACHPHGYRTLARLTPPRGAEVVQVAHGLDTARFRPAAGPREPGLILAVGRLTPKKGFEHLLRACALLAERGRAIRCVVIGDGRCRKGLERLRRELGLERSVELLPAMSQAALLPWYRRASLFVMPSQVLDDGNRDGIPNVMLEAMACATPVIGTAVGSIAELLEEGVNGLLVPSRSPGALAGAIGRLLDDPRLAASLGRRAAEGAARLDYRRTNRSLAERFRPLVATGAAASLRRVDRDAWRRGGLADKAGQRLGVPPARRPEIERAIAASVAPGIQANAWRPDLDHLAARRLWDEAVKARRVPALLEALMLDGPGHRILDLGCGRGGLTVALAAAGQRVVGLDLRHRNCTVARLRGRRYDLEVDTANSAGEKLPFRNGTFDAVVCLEVLEHVLDPIALLQEIRRVLRPEGACVLTVINRWAHLDPHYRLWGLNFLPRRAANGYIRLRRRTKRSYRDLQTLDEMHYYSFRRFLELAAELDYAVEDPEAPRRRLASALHTLRRWSSLGFNTATVVLRPAR